MVMFAAEVKSRWKYGDSHGMKHDKRCLKSGSRSGITPAQRIARLLTYDQQRNI